MTNIPPEGYHYVNTTKVRPIIKETPKPDCLIRHRHKILGLLGLIGALSILLCIKPNALKNAWKWASQTKDLTVGGIAARVGAGTASVLLPSIGLAALHYTDKKYPLAQPESTPLYLVTEYRKLKPESEGPTAQPTIPANRIRGPLHPLLQSVTHQPDLALTNPAKLGGLGIPFLIAGIATLCLTYTGQLHIVVKWIAQHPGAVTSASISTMAIYSLSLHIIDRRYFTATRLQQAKIDRMFKLLPEEKRSDDTPISYREKLQKLNELLQEKKQTPALDKGKGRLRTLQHNPSTVQV